MKYLIYFLLILLLIGCTTDVTENNMINNLSIDQNNDSIIMSKQSQEEPKTLKELAKVEVKEYNGEKLDSIVDVRDVSIKGPQNIDIENYRLEVFGLVDNPKNYTYEEVLSYQKYSKVVNILCVLGWDATVLWEGVLLKDLFEEVGPTDEVNTVIFYAADGYTTSLPLGYIIDNNIILADKINNVTLVPERGFPFELVAESKLGYKWIKWVTKIELSDDPDYRGYWESKGYSNKADIDGTYTD